MNQDERNEWLAREIAVELSLARAVTPMTALRRLAEAVGIVPQTRLAPDQHDRLCESEFFAPHGGTPCDCRNRTEYVLAALDQARGAGENG